MASPQFGPDVPGQRRPAEPAPASRYELFVDVAKDLARVRTAYDAELLVSTMLGAAYGIADTARMTALADTASGLRQHLSRRRSHQATLLRAVLAALVQPPTSRAATVTASAAKTRSTAATGPPAWLEHLGSVKLTGSYAFADEYQDQVSYLATFAYTDEENGGPEHVLSALVDHNLGYVKDLFVAAPAAALLAQLGAAAATDETMRLFEVEPGELRATVESYLSMTDELRQLPDTESLTSDRALAAHRLRLLPTAGAPPTRPGAEDFRAAPEARRLSQADEDSLEFCLRLIAEYASSDPLRWSPAAVQAFLLDWVPARAVLDRADTRLLPAVLSAWVRWAGRISGLTPRAVAQSVAAVAQTREEFTTRIQTGSHREPATKAMAQLLADGVDPNDDDAVAAWLAEYNANEGS
jgi:hypothetical protein